MFVKKQEFDILASLVRSTTAFKNIQLRDHVLSRLKTEYPMSLKDWDRADRKGFTRVRKLPAVHFEALLLCREQHIYTALPAILYNICAKYSMVGPSCSKTECVE